jgi:hypothetical protein
MPTQAASLGRVHPLPSTTSLQHGTAVTAAADDDDH